MSQQRTVEDIAKLQVTNIGGIDHSTVEFRQGVTILSGRNASNRTSLLQAVMTVCGSDQATLKGDTDEGTVELTIGNNTYTRTLTQEDDRTSLSFSGEPYLDDPSETELFAFLLETNEARQAVQQTEKLRDIIMQPVDTDAIQREIDQLEQEKRELEQQLDELDDFEQTLSERKERRSQLKSDIEDKRNELAAKETELDNTDATVAETRENKTEIEDKLDDLRETRSRLEDVRFELETQHESIEQLRDEQDNLQAEYDDLPDPNLEKRENLTEERNQLRKKKDRLESELNELQRLIQFNENMLEGGDIPAFTSEDEQETNNSGDMTDQLLADSTKTITCWTCGTTVDREQINATVDQLRDFRQQKVSNINDLEDDIDNLEAKRQEIRETQQRREEVEQRLDEIANKISERETTINELKAERKELTNTVDTLESEVEELENDAYMEILDLHKEANQIEFEVDRLESDLEGVQAEISEIEDKLEQRDQIEQQRAGVQNELTDLRTHIEQLEAQAVEEFNEHMETVLNSLGYENLDRIWLERKETQVREGRRKVEKTVFDLHVIRKTDEGTTYEDTVTHLSESEREVTGLVFALAGYITHEIYESIPFMLLDSIEALDADRIAALVTHLQEYVPFLVIALLPEDAAALSDDYHYITDI